MKKKTTIGDIEKKYKVMSFYPSNMALSTALRLSGSLVLATLIEMSDNTK